MTFSSLGILLLAAVVFTTAGCARHEAAPRTEAARQFGNIGPARLLNPAAGDWLTTGGDYGKTHFSGLDQINRQTAARLGFAWEYDTGTRRGLEATPIVVDGVLYGSGEFGRVYALDAATGRPIWTFDPHVDGQLTRKACCDAVNRGVAVWQGLVYVAAFDGRLFALNAATGAIVWQADTIIDKTRGYTSTGAPQVAGRVVVIGNAGNEHDARGYVSAWDLRTGQFKWRFFSVPGDPARGFEHPELQMAAKTWDPHSRWEVGLGGAAWDGMVYDPTLNLLYVGTGNGVLYDPAKRSPAGGDNLFLVSILAINPDTGRLAWYFQETPAEGFDFEATAPMVLADLTLGGTVRKVLMQAPKNGFFYVLDRRTGQFISARNFVPQNWATRIDPVSGRATLNRAHTDYSKSPALVFPSALGGHSWQPMAYSPRSGLAYMAVLEAGNFLYDPEKNPIYRPGLRNEGTDIVYPNPGVTPQGMPAPVAAAIRRGQFRHGYPDPAPRSFIRAWDPVAQREVWSVSTSGLHDRAGMLATGGGILITGSTTGKLRVLDDRNGSVLKEIEVGSSIVAAPATYLVNGVQYVAVMAAIGGGLFSDAPPPDTAASRYGNAGRVLAFRLDGPATPLPQALPPPAPVPQPPPLTASPQVIARGDALFSQYCSNCHFNLPGGVPPDLRRMDAAAHRIFNRIVLEGVLRPNGMPQWDDVLTTADVDAIHEYLISISWNAYRAQRSGADLPHTAQSSNVH
ncbi:MAG TPA: PQQ-dependent dehydrogenase, methanol/ethanol family [Steroidobacteraceae bacterium]